MHSRRYSAFISYRHADNTQEGRRWAEWLHRGLERYVVPPDLIGTPNLRGEPIRDSLYPIFRDEDELPANADLATGIRAALELSDHLIVLCSPRSAVSPWVRKEVREFKEFGRSDRILAIIIAGEPNADDPAKAREGILRDEECFCEELRFGAVRDDGTLDWTIRTEPLAADLRPNGTRAEGFVTAEAYREHLTLNSSLTSEKIATRTEAYRQQLDLALIKIIAGLLGVALGTLKDRDAAHRAELSKQELDRAEAEASRLRALNRRLTMAGAAMLVLGMIALAGAWYGQSQATKATAQRDEARYNEGLAWLLRAEVAEERSKRYPDTLLYAAQAIGFEGVGRPANAALPLRYIPTDREAFTRAAKWIADRPAYLPVWASPLLNTPVTAMNLSPSGRWLALANADGRVVLWNLSSGQQHGVIDADATSVTDFAFDPAERILALASKDKTQFFDLSTQTLSTAHPGSGSAIAWSPSGEVLAVSSDAGITLWRNEQAKLMTADLSVPAARLVFSAENSLIAATYPGKGVRVFFPHAGAAAYAWLTHKVDASGVDISPDGKRIAIGTADGAITLWSSADARPLGIVPQELWHHGPVLDLAFRPDGRQLASASADGTVKLWSVATDTPRVLATLCGHLGAVNRVSFAQGGELLASAGADGSARLWSVAGKPAPNGDLFVYLERRFFHFDASTQQAQWAGGFGFVSNSPLPVEGALTAPDPTALLADAQAAASDNHWHLADLRLHQLAAVGVVDGPAIRQIQAARTAFAREGLPFTNANGIALRWCPPTGSDGFLMGSPLGEKDRYDSETLHKVILTSGFWLGQYEVTQAEWTAIMGDRLPSTIMSSGPQAPVENISWTEAVEFCCRLSDREHARGTLPSGWEYALPTEAQWEYACRAGTATAYYFGDDPAHLSRHGNYNDKRSHVTDSDMSQDDGFKYTAPVGSYRTKELKRNSWGFYDMHGNVWEWCADSVDLLANGYMPEYPSQDLGGATDPLSTKGTLRIDRGGGWNSAARVCRSANRAADPPSDRFSNLGFRVALVRVRK